MPKLFVANTSKQKWMFTYRLPHMNSHFTKEIPPGKQICLDHLQSDDIARVIEHNQIYGMKPSEEVSRRKGYTGLTYRLDKPVEMDSMLETYDSNDTALTDAAQQRRVDSTVAASDGIASALNVMTGIDKEKMRPVKVTQEVIEETEGNPRVAAGVEVSRTPGGKSQR